jgi:flagellar basal body-associated protein FliL
MEIITTFWIVAIIAVVGVIIWYFMSGKKETGETKQEFQMPPATERPEEREKMKEDNSQEKPEV